VSAPEAHLYIWTTGAFIVEAHELAEAWGFAPKGVIPWIKIKRDANKHIEAAGGNLHAALRMGMGRYVRWCSEYVVFCVRGKLLPLRRDVVGAFFAEIGAHSEKPDALYKLIQHLSPGPRLELFARTLRPGYISWGLEVGIWQPKGKIAKRAKVTADHRASIEIPNQPGLLPT
jgi:N6-adenosine-specific RNA methylase IME4